MENRCRPSSFFGDLRSRELNGLRVRKRSHLGDLSSDASGAGAGVLAIEHDGEPSPPTAVSFCKSSRNPHLLAVSDEEGYISFYDTRRSLPSYSSCWEGAGQARVCNWIAHSNAIFDICWNKEDNQILTASGDQHIKIWNAEKRTCTGSLAGHTGSVKTVCSHSSNPDLVVSGSRDGSFALWDLRCSFSSTNRFGETCLSPISLVNDAHALTQRKRGRRGKADSKSITSVLYLKDGISIATAGAVNSVVKFWDTRNLKTSIIQTCPAAEPSTKSEKIQHGITSLSQDSYGVSLAASCRDNRIYLYDVLKLDRGPIKIFSGSKIGSFFVKSVISLDGAHILGGSSDDNAYIWQVRRPESAPTILKGHQGEVTSVDWCSSELGKVVTSSDDFMVRVWKMNKDGCLNTRSPAAIRKRIIAPSVEPRRLILDEPPTCSASMKDNFQAMEATVHEPSSPAQCKVVEFRTPESGRKRSSSFLMDGKEMQESLEAISGSPSSVLSPPPSTKRRTILDYYHSV
ncbi:denticleless protein homolog [Zingiber officinale]|uniref:denticleless protein homolog n=1 Tax=Zingiber officinale TaxID=94328 RepID=UPI001C4AAFF7|nr:denticleless protein homolog [Zingiber officinale]